MSTQQEKIAALSTEIWHKKQELQKLRLESEAETVKDYVFTNHQGKNVKLSDLFKDKDDLLVIHNMGKGCSYCTMWADGFESSRQHIENRASFVMVSPDDPVTQKAFADSRGWSFEMLSAEKNGFIKDMGFAKDDHLMPGVSAFHKDAQGKLYRTNQDFFGPYDDYNPVWNLLSLLKEGANDWQPQFSYGQQ